MENTGRILYFAYGHNTNPQIFKKRVRSAVQFGPAKLPHYSLSFMDYANIVPNKQGTVTGMLWGMDPKEVGHLDYEEGYGNHYKHMPVKVIYKNKLYKALAYVMLPRQDLGQTPSRKYINDISIGYKLDHLPITQLQTALQNRLAQVKK